jgi:hypothetical protein
MRTDGQVDKHETNSSAPKNGVLNYHINFLLIPIQTTGLSIDTHRKKFQKDTRNDIWHSKYDYVCTFRVKISLSQKQSGQYWKYIFITLVARSQVWVQAECPVPFVILTEVTRGSRFIRNVSARLQGVTSQGGILRQIPSVQLQPLGTGVFVNTFSTGVQPTWYGWALFLALQRPESEAMECPSLQCADL